MFQQFLITFFLSLLFVVTHQQAPHWSFNAFPGVLRHQPRQDSFLLQAFGNQASRPAQIRSDFEPSFDSESNTFDEDAQQPRQLKLQQFHDRHMMQPMGRSADGNGFMGMNRGSTHALLQLANQFLAQKAKERQFSNNLMSSFGHSVAPGHK